jgi:signal transduction histidine kinase
VTFGPSQTQTGRPTRGRSLRTQLVAWNILTLALLLAILGGIVRYTVQKTIMLSVDHDLERQAGPPGGGPPPHAPAPPPANGANGPDMPGGPPDDGPPGADAPPIRFQRADGGGPNDNRNPYHPRMFDLQGKPRDQNHPFQPWDPDALTLARQGQPIFTNVTVDDVPLRVLTRLLPPRGPSPGLVQAAYPLTDVRRAMGGVDSALLILIPVALVCAGLAGATLTDRVLGRVRLMTQAAGRISGQNFSDRLPVTGQDEFSELAATFNGMLGRQETAFQQQQRLIEQQRRFTADASHELKTPLTIIKGNTSMALSVPPDPADFQQSMQDIDRAADSMQRLVQDLLLLARSDSGQLARDQVELLVRDILTRAIRLSVADETLSVCGTEDELVRLFGNLLTNAVRHTPPEGRITVEAKRQGLRAIISIADTGAGIAPEHLPHLGERFYRVDSSRARLDGGTGLGLSICRGIAEAHGGTMTFQSAPGVGTTVRVSLPAA